MENCVVNLTERRNFYRKQLALIRKMLIDIRPIFTIMTEFQANLLHVQSITQTWRRSHMLLTFEVIRYEVRIEKLNYGVA